MAATSNAWRGTWDTATSARVEIAVADRVAMVQHHPGDDPELDVSQGQLVALPPQGMGQVVDGHVTDLGGMVPAPARTTATRVVERMGQGRWISQRWLGTAGGLFLGFLRVIHASQNHHRVSDAKRCIVGSSFAARLAACG